MKSLLFVFFSFNVCHILSPLRSLGGLPGIFFLCLREMLCVFNQKWVLNFILHTIYTFHSKWPIHILNCHMDVYMTNTYLRKDYFFFVSPVGPVYFTHFFYWFYKYIYELNTERGARYFCLKWGKSFTEYIQLNILFACDIMCLNVYFCVLISGLSFYNKMAQYPPFFFVQFLKKAHPLFLYSRVCPIYVSLLICICFEI